MRYRFTLALLAVAGPASAQIDAEPKTPYLWRVVLKTESHPLLSPAFRLQLQRDLMAALQPAIGPLGTVEVIDLAGPHDKDPLIQQFQDKGFAVLDAPRDLTGVKTHFLTVAYRDGRYHLESRQHDGFTGLASPLVRKQAVRSAELVGRTAGLMLDRDFGLTASADPVNAPKGGNVTTLKVTIRGWQLAPPDRFVKDGDLVKIGDVFAMSQINKSGRASTAPVRTATGKIITPAPGTEGPPAYTANPRAFTLLRVTDVGKDGTLTCAVFSRFANPAAPGPNVVGYRFMKLGTVDAPLTIHLKPSNPASPAAVGRVTVRGTEVGFGTAPDAKDLFDFKDGLFRSGRPLSNLACVTVSLGGGNPKLFPVPVLGPDAVSLPFEVDPKAEAQAAHLRELLDASGRVADARQAHAICVAATGALIEKKKNSEALTRARDGYKAADNTDKLIAETLARLKDQPDQHPEAPRVVAVINAQLDLLRKDNALLAAPIKELEGVVARENDPKIAARDVQAQALATRITLLLSRGDVDEAINAYDQLVTLLPDDAAVKAARDKLKADWASKNDVHTKARDYLLKTWPAVATIPDFKDSVPLVKREVQVCKANNDRLGLRKLLTGFNAAAVKLNDLVSPLDANSDTDRKLLDDAKKVGEEMAALEKDITEFINKK